MQIAGIVVAGMLWGVSVLLVSLRIPRPNLSEFELLRRRELGDTSASFGLRRQKALPAIEALRWAILMLIGVGSVILFVAALGFMSGSLVAVLTALMTGPLARLSLARRGSQRLYRKIETRIISFTKKYRRPLKLLAPPLEVSGHASLPQSREELEHLLKETKQLVSPEEAMLLGRALRFYGLRAEAVMTPVDDIVSVETSEVLGPLVLDKLHKTHHSLFPVTNGETVVGLLDISDSVNLRRRESPEARDVMRHDMVRLPSSEPLDEVLQVMIDTKQTSLLLTNVDGDVVGLISLGDVVRALTGWRRRQK